MYNLYKFHISQFQYFINSPEKEIYLNFEI